MMRKKLTTSTVFLSAVLLAGVVFSAPVDKEELASECGYLGSSLRQLANANTKEYCSVDVNYSGVLMEQSAALIKARRMQFAIDNLNVVHRTLQRVSANLWDCAYFSSMVTPYVKKAQRLIGQLEQLPKAAP